MSNFDFNNITNNTIRQIPPSGIRKFFDVVSTMKNAVSLGVGEPDFVTPWAIREAGIRSLEIGHTHYTSNSGLMELRETICKYLKRRFDLTYSYDQVLISVGGSEAIDCIFRCLVSPGDEIIMCEPNFVCYAPLVSMCGGVPVIIETKAENEFRLTPDELKAAITPKTKALLLTYPNNPTGGIMRKEDLRALADILVNTNIAVVSDEIYAELTYSGKHFSIASFEDMKDRTVIVSGFSKAFAMTGWRLGYACGPVSIIKNMTKLHQYAIMCAPTASQYAAIEAMTSCDNEVEKMKEEYNLRRQFIHEGFNKLGLSCFNPQGAFYLFPCIRSTGMTSEEFCQKLLNEQSVAVVPGSAFGKSGEGFVRCSYAQSMSTITEALQRIEIFLANHSHC